MSIKNWFKNLGTKTKRLGNIIKIMFYELLVLLILTNGFFIWLLLHYKLFDDLILKIVGK